MKQLVALTTILVVIGIGGFMYRNALERPIVIQDSGACTQEAKLCPDGTSVGRTGPDCAFAACALPNAEDSATGISFVIPAGYAANPDSIGADETLRAVFDKPISPEESHSIIIRRYPILEGESANSAILAHTLLEPKGEAPTSMDAYTSVQIGGHTFMRIGLERFEGIVRTAYFLARDTDVVTFEIVERGVDWTNPDLATADLPEHKALVRLLSTLQAN
ncbi:MAG: hypothetical protein AAB921_00670 [Patescibacteria group bacterium]